MVEVSPKKPKRNFFLKSSFLLLDNNLKRKSIEVVKRSASFIKIVFFDTPKFEFTKKEIFIYEKKKTNHNAYYIDFKRGKKRIEKSDAVFKTIFPFLVIEARSKPTFFKISPERKIRGNLYFDVSLKNPIAETETKFPDFIEADFLVSEKEVTPFTSLGIFLKENFSQKFEELKIPFVLDEEKADLKVGKEDLTATALSKSLLKQILKIEGYLSGVIKNHDPEYIHEMRVALRKARSYLTIFPEIFGPKKSKLLSIELSSYALDLARLRDLDVFENHLQSFCKEIGSEGKEKEVIKFVQEIKKDEIEIVQRVFASAKFKKLVSRLKNSFRKSEARNFHGRKLFCESAKEKFGLLKTEIKKRTKKFRTKGTPDLLHKVRISFKKLRYLFEISECFWKKDQAKMKKILSEMQDCLGYHQDLLIAENNLLNFSKKSDDKEALLLCGALIHLIYEKKEKEIKKFAKIYREFEKIEIPDFCKGGRNESGSSGSGQSRKCNSKRPLPR